MKTDKPSLLILAILGLAVLLSFGFLIIIPFYRQLTPVETGLISFIIVLFSTVSGWYFSRIYSKGENYDEAVSRIIKILEGCTKVGIDAVEPSLRNGTTTIKALDKISYGFDFLGIAGSKFVPQLFDEAKNIGRFIAKNERYSVRLMFLDPECSQIDRWIGDRKKADKVRSDIHSTLSLLASQIRKGRKIQVRLYGFSPPIRLQIIDKEKAYLCECDPFSDGWDTPQICFSKKGDKPFIDSLISLYDYLWEHGKDFDSNQ